MKGPLVKLALIGDPIDHSRSPAMHAAAGEATGVALTYEARRVAVGTAKETLRRLHDEGYAGLNVTVPLKIEVLDALRADRDATVDPAAARIGAVNTLVRAGSSWRAFNSDAPGFVRSLPGDVPERAIVLGAGGAARAVVVGLVVAGVRVELSARRPEAAEALVDLGAAPSLWPPVLDAPLVVNATSASLHGGETFTAQFDWRLPSSVHVVDLAYGDALPFLLRAAHEGASVQDGKAMLVHQGALAFEAWTGRDAPVEAMFAAI